MIHVEFTKTQHGSKLKCFNKLSAEHSQYHIFPKYLYLVWSLDTKRVETRARSPYMHSLHLQTCNKSSYMATGLSSAFVHQMKRGAVTH